MPPKAHTSNSESESRARSNAGNQNTGAVNNNARNSGKQRLTAAQQQYLRDLIRTHVQNNHPDNFPKAHPVDFEAYSDEFLRRYKDHFQLPLEDNLSLQGYILGSKLGEKTYSFKRNETGVPGARVTKKRLASEVKKHFTSYNVKETECIPAFIYKVKNQKKRFKMEFKD
ncbi:LANO_0F13608g1_1 [Lachancea nothofagi CBS 11611]|uniref:LANO_0F13608g1_1 n=1 Tax=Lachancea nothofagi CBS 11611 TaxID=1266666 RepID=A0A1G4KC00_9SACH|nr:LANO_0F13608g1_1 [Lachancea nothofagi CBS 11611]